MPASDALVIGQLAQAAADEWWATMCTEDGSAMRAELARAFFVNSSDPRENEALEAEAQRSVSNPEASVFPAHRRGEGGEMELLGPRVHARGVRAENGVEYSAALTVKPVLSFRHARNCMQSKDDGRTALIGAVQRALQCSGLAQFAATAGGRSSIDIMKQGITKKYAVSFLIEALGLAGIATEGEEVRLLN